MCYCVLFVTSTRRRRLGPGAASRRPAPCMPYARARRQRLLLRAYVSKNRCSRQEDRNELGMQAFLTATARRGGGRMQGVCAGAGAAAQVRSEAKRLVNRHVVHPGGGAIRLGRQ